MRGAREWFQTLVERCRAKPDGFPAYAELDEDVKAEFRRLTDFKLHSQFFSDTTVLYSPLALPCGDVTVFGVYAVLFGTAMTLLDHLAKGIALRGGIEVGVGTEFFDREIYGPVLHKAYRLENSVARYPRVVVGPELHEWLHVLIRGHGDSIASRANKKYAKESLRLIAKDTDGEQFLDFLGAGLNEEISGDPLWVKAVEDSFEFVSNERRRFATISDGKLEERYAHLQRYYKNNIDRWLS